MDAYDWLARFFGIALFLGGLGTLGVSLWYQDWMLLSGGMTTTLVGVTLWYAREARAARIYERKRGEIFEVWRPIIDIVDKEVLARLLTHAHDVAPVLERRKELDFWRLPDDILEEYRAIREDSLELGELRVKTHRDLRGCPFGVASTYSDSRSSGRFRAYRHIQFCNEDNES